MLQVAQHLQNIHVKSRNLELFHVSLCPTINFFLPPQRISEFSLGQSYVEISNCHFATQAPILLQLPGMHSKNHSVVPIVPGRILEPLYLEAKAAHVVHL